MTAAPRVRLQIDALQLHGFPLAQRDAIVETLERELARLIEQRGVPSQHELRFDRLRLDCAPAHEPSDAGRDAARVLYAQLVQLGIVGARAGVEP
jgi:hypothetical protein